MIQLGDQHFMLSPSVAKWPILLTQLSAQGLSCFQVRVHSRETNSKRTYQEAMPKGNDPLPTNPFSNTVLAKEHALFHLTLKTHYEDTFRRHVAPPSLAPHCLVTPHFPVTPHFGAALFGATLFGDATFSCDATFWRHIVWRHIVW